jgi:hypothetical protein
MLTEHAHQTTDALVEVYCDKPFRFVEPWRRDQAVSAELGAALAAI